MLYSKKVLQHFQHPHNYGKIKDPDGLGKVGNPICGDVMWLYIRVAKNKQGKDIIKNIKFETFGCTAAIATSSAITDIAKGQTIREALKTRKEKIITSLGGLPPIKIHCSLLATDALDEAIYDYLFKNKKYIPQWLEKKHQQIEKEKKLIKEKYGFWLEMEEKLHSNGEKNNSKK